MKKFFQEFKKFITRGNVIDMSVGVIVGSSFTAIVNGLSNFILKPLINWLLSVMLGDIALDKVYYYLKRVEIDGEIDLAKSIYIDWGSFINAVINFFIVAFVLFSIVKLINKLREGGKKIEDGTIAGLPSRDDRRAMKKLGISIRDKEAVNKYLADKAQKAALEKAEAEEKARIEKENNPSVEELLKQIRDIIKAQDK